MSADWNVGTDVLTTKSFPATSILRWGSKGTHTCQCSSHERHRSLFDFLKRVLVPVFQQGSDITPAIKVCWNAENLWECKIPRKLSGLDKRLDFYSMPSMWHAQKVLMEGTYWFPRLMGKKDANGNNSIHGKAILRLIGGFKTYTGPEETYLLASKQRKISREGVNKLRSILATVDGLLMQIVLSFFETGFPTWDRLDQVVYCMITNLLPDYFRKGTDNDLSRLSTFEKVKKLRKAIKQAGFNPQLSVADIHIPQELSFFKTIVNMIGPSKAPLNLDRVMTLSQTRASGVPPKTVYLKTLQKMKETLQSPPDPSVYDGMRFYIDGAIHQIHNDVVSSMSEEKREKFFSRCLLEAKISLSDSGEFFTKTHEGGKLEAARLVLSQHQRIEEIDLETGVKTGNWLDKSNSTMGDMLFHWACGMFQDRDHIYEHNLMSVRISLVSELGKYRGITVSHLAHSVLLHVASHILLKYIEEIPSSRSGVSAANHAWNFFKLLSHKNPMANFIFGENECFVYSTDWEQATDYGDHLVSQAELNILSDLIGFPRWYRQTFVFALCAPRQVEYLDDEGKTLEAFYTTRGILMGDPVTKVALHLYHLVARYAARYTLQVC